MHRIHLFPRWETNPYLAMLTTEARAQGWQIEGSTHTGPMFAALDALERGDVFHLHWTAPLADVSTEEEYEARIARFDTALSAAEERGVRVLWTVHNVTTHDAAHPDQEVTLGRMLAHRAQRIIVLASRTADVVAPLYSLPAEKVVHLPHSSYQGIYPPSPRKEAARERLGIPKEQRVLGMVGGIRPYKGVDEMLAAAKSLASDDPRVAAVLAGGASRAEIEHLERILPRTMPVHRRYGTLADEDLVLWSVACDVHVLPYTAILNSGSMFLAATLGVPVVLPALPHLLADHGQEEWIEFFDPAAPDRVRAVANAVTRVLDSPPGQREEAALAFARAHLPRSMAVRYLELLPQLAAPMTY